MQPITLLVSTLLLAGGRPPAPDLAIVGARIEIGDGRVVENGTIIVRGDRILSVGTDAAPAGSTTIDGKGLTVYPGFIDAYSTSGLKLPEPVKSGDNPPDTVNTAPATMWHENRKNLRADVQAAKSIDLKGPFTERYADGVTSVLLSGGTGTLAGTAALVDLAAEPKVVVSQAASEIIFRSGGGGFRGGADVHDGYMGGAVQRPGAAQAPATYNYPGTLFGIFALLRQTLADAKLYAAQEKPKADPTYEGLRPLVTGKIPALFTVYNARDIDRAARVAEEFGLRMIVNGTSDGYRMIDILKARRAPVVLSLEPTEEPSRTVATGPDAVPKRVLVDRWQVWKELQGNAKALNDAGVPLAFRGATEGYLAGVRRLVAAGLPRDAALRAMTINPATMYGAAERLGTIETGKIANLVLMTGDFVDPKSTVKSVLVEGTRFEAKKESAK